MLTSQKESQRHYVPPGERGQKLCNLTRDIEPKSDQTYSAAPRQETRKTSVMCEGTEPQIFTSKIQSMRNHRLNSPALPQIT